MEEQNANPDPAPQPTAEPEVQTEISPAKNKKSLMIAISAIAVLLLLAGGVFGYWQLAGWPDWQASQSPSPSPSQSSAPEELGILPLSNDKTPTAKLTSTKSPAPISTPKASSTQPPASTPAPRPGIYCLKPQTPEKLVQDFAAALKTNNLADASYCIGFSRERIIEGLKLLTPQELAELGKFTSQATILKKDNDFVRYQCPIGDGDTAEFEARFIEDENGFSCWQITSY